LSRKQFCCKQTNNLVNQKLNDNKRKKVTRTIDEEKSRNILTFQKKRKQKLKHLKKKQKSKVSTASLLLKKLQKNKIEENHITSCRLYFFPMQGHNYSSSMNYSIQ
jgi:hypothetical protein